MSADRHGIGMTSARTRGRLVERLRAHGISSERVLEAIREIPRHLFIDEALSHRAYEDTALPIGAGQTISQPYIVARMTEALLANNPKLDRVLEIGTGSGYQTAVLARVSTHLYTVERIEPLLKIARKQLRELRLLNVQFRLGDGAEGWAEHAPYDGILVTAAPSEVPPPLIAQLSPTGRLVIPVGEGSRQELLVIRRDGDRQITERLEAVQFVPLLPSVSAGNNA